MSRCTRDLAEIGPEMADVTSSYIYIMAAVGHLGFTFCSFWTTHDVQLGGYIFPASGAMIQSDLTETLQF